MIKNIIFDLGGVIINYNQKQIVDEFAKTDEERTFLLEKVFKAPEWAKCDLGEISNEDACEEILKRENNIYEKMTRDFWKRWYKTRKMNEEIIQIAKDLKARGYNIYVLSNMSIPTYEYFSTHEFFKLCSGIVISAQEHVKKPDERIFNILLNRYNLKADECLFIDDDDTGKSFETARKLGINGRKVIQNSSIDVKKELKEFDVLI